jgi:co-chaperonin GroES (HSP10)
MQPINNQIYVKPFPATEAVGSFIVPDSAKKRPAKATVLKVGRGSKMYPMTLKEGDIVFHVQGAGVQFINDNKEEYWLIQSMDCLAYIQKGGTD